MKTKKKSGKTPADHALDKKIVYVKDLRGESHPIRLTNTTHVHPALKDYFCYCLLKASNQTKVDLDKALIPFQFQTVHFAVLSVIEQDDAPPQNQVADQMGIDKASMVKLIDHLESLKIVERVSDSEDRRCKRLHITAHGKSVIVKAKEAACQAEKAFMQKLTPEEQKLLKKLIPLLLP